MSNTLNQKIEELLYNRAKDFEIAKAIREDLKEYFKTLPEVFNQSGGKDFLVKHTKKIDSIIKIAYRVACREMFEEYIPLKNNIPITLVALGSYGREQMSLYSDIDLMIVYQDIPAYNVKEIIQKLLYILWDSKLKLGHRVHSLEELFEVANSDITIKTAMLESRFIDGSKMLWTKVQNTLSDIRKYNQKEFILEKIQERRAHHQKYPLTMEPNLKDGVGGFRDANMVYWIGKLLYNVPRIKELDTKIVTEEDYKEFRIALEFIFKVRTALHIVARKKIDTLRLEYLPDVARSLKLGDDYKAQMKLAKRVIGSLKTINLYSKIWIERLVRQIVPEIYKGYFLPEIESTKLSDILDSIEINSPFRAHPRLLSNLIHAKKPERVSKKIYKSVAKIFERKYSYSIFEMLLEAKLLGYLIPPMKKVIDLPQFDGYHRYSVDRHSVETLKALENIEDEFLKEIFESLPKSQKAMLKVVALLHDAGKGRKKDHHLVGASLFKIFAENLGMKEELIKMGEKLILHHTLMSKTAQREDIYNQKVVMRFASRFGSKNMLDLIYLLTYADMSGVGSGVYNSYTARLIKTLYKESLEALSNEHLLDETTRRVRAVDRLKRSQSFSQIPKILQNKILSIDSDAFFIRHTSKEIVAIAKEAYEVEDFKYLISNEKFLTIEVIRKIDFNLAYLLFKLNRLQVVSMEIVKLFDGIKYFKIDFNDKLDDDEIPLLEKHIKDSFRPQGKLPLKKPQIKEGEITIDCEHSKEYATMTLRTKNQSGLLAYLINVFDQFGIDIATAKIHTLKGRVNDLFLIEKNGNFCSNLEKLKELYT
jgi:[protein-PII] uridylyltransferase